MIEANKAGICPHCNVHVFFLPVSVIGLERPIGGLRLTTFKEIVLDISTVGCPACGEPIVVAKATGPEWMTTQERRKLNILLWPESGARPAPQEVKTEAPSVADDFYEATAVLPKSKKASAALARRCLQTILREKGGTQSHNLSGQIDEIINNLPQELGQNVDAVRQVGNFAAHEMKSTNSGEIADVEEGEAEWLLSILEDLFQHYYVAPAKARANREALNQKLRALNKSELKQPNS